LSDPTGTYGVKRNDTDAVVVADDTDMTRISTGVYQYSFSDTEGIAYTGYVEIVYGGATYHFEVDIQARYATTVMAASYSSLLERVGHFLFGIRSGFSSDQTDDIEECIQDGLHDVYSAHRWSFFRPLQEITTVDGTAEYSLPIACEAIEGDLNYEPGESDFYPPVEQRHDSEIRKRQQDADSTDTGRPLYFSVRNVEFDPTVGSRRQVVLFPTPDDAYVLLARMKLRPTMIDAVNQYPVGGEAISQLIVEACLAAAERNYDEEAKHHTRRFMELLPLAIAADNEMTSPTTLGPDAPKGESENVYSRAMLCGDLTLNGVTL
jgi:hypothetical protein